MQQKCKYKIIKHNKKLLNCVFLKTCKIHVHSHEVYVIGYHIKVDKFVLECLRLYYEINMCV